MSMHYWKVTLKCTSPVCIGSGETCKKSQYIYDCKERKVYFLREEKWISFLGIHGIIDDFANELLRNPSQFKLFAYLSHQPLLLKRYRNYFGIKKALLASGAMEEGEDYLASTGADGKNGPKDIVRFIRDGEGYPYIPGTSLKGAFRTAILSHEIRKHPEIYERDWKAIENGAGDKKKMGSAMDGLERRLSLAPDKEGRLDMVNSYFRGLSISDATLVDGGLCVVPKADLSVRADDTHQVALYREALNRHSKLAFTLGIDDSEKGMGHFGIRNFDDLQQVLQEFVQLQYDMLKKPFLENAKYELSDIENAHNADMLLGAGTGFLSKTLIYSLAPDKASAVRVTKKLMERLFPRGKHARDTEISPHALKLVETDENTYLMGMCYLEAKPLC